MHIYLAGGSVCDPSHSPAIQEMYKKGHKLHSFFHCQEESGLEGKWYRTNMKNKVDLILDSGAFSAWMSRTEINIEEYADFCLKHLDKISYIVNLDVIPGSWGKAPSSKEAEIAARQGWRNYHYMLKKGIPAEKLIHVFHQGDDFKWLRMYIERGLKYIGLSPANDKTTNQKIEWLDQCMEFATDNEGFPLNKWHGFGVTSHRILIRYPWYSVDSTTWVILSRNGSILVPKKRNGIWIYTEDAWKIAVSARSPTTKEAGKHISTLSPKQKEIILEYVHEKGHKIGQSEFKYVSQSHKTAPNERWAEKKPQNKTKQRLLEIIIEPGLCNTYRKRDELNIEYYLDLEKDLPKWPWPFKARYHKGMGL